MLDIPRDESAEQQVISSCIMDPEACFQVSEILSVPDFYVEKHRIIYAQIQTMLFDGDPIELPLICTRLNEAGKLEQAGGVNYLIEVSQKVASSANAKHYAEIVKERSAARQIQIIMQTGLLKSSKEAAQASVLMEHLDHELMTVPIIKTNSGLNSITYYAGSANDQFYQLTQAGGTVGLQTGYPTLDKTLCGLKKSDLIILAARPSIGKSAFAVNLSYTIAERYKCAVGYFSLEMTGAQLLMRMVASLKELNLHAIQTGFCGKAVYDQALAGLNEISTLPIYIDDTSSPTIQEIRSKTMRLAAESKNLGLIIVDYIGLIPTPEIKGKSREQEVAYISRSLKALARQANVPVIAVSQLSRANEKRSPSESRPRLSDLRDSGCIEQDADVVIFLHAQDKDTDERELIIAKHRNGKTGQMLLNFNRNQQRFTELDLVNQPSAMQNYQDF